MMQLWLLVLFIFFGILNFSSCLVDHPEPGRDNHKVHCHSFYSSDTVNAVDLGYCWRFFSQNFTFDSAYFVCGGLNGRLPVVSVEKANKLSKFINDSYNLYASGKMGSRYIEVYKHGWPGSDEVWMSSATNGSWDSTNEIIKTNTEVPPDGKNCALFNYKMATWHFTNCTGQKHPVVCEEKGHKYPDEVAKENVAKAKLAMAKAKLAMSTTKVPKLIPNMSPTYVPRSDAKLQCHHSSYSKHKANAVKLGYCWRFCGRNFTFDTASRICGSVHGRIPAVNTVGKAKKLSEFISESIHMYASGAMGKRYIKPFENGCLGGSEVWISSTTNGNWSSTEVDVVFGKEDKSVNDSHGQKCMVFNYKKSTWRSTHCTGKKHPIVCEEEGHKYPDEAAEDE